MERKAEKGREEKKEEKKRKKYVHAVFPLKLNVRPNCARLAVDCKDGE